MKGSINVDLEWADGEYSFALKSAQIEELENISRNFATGKNGIGIGAIWARVMVNAEWSKDDLRNIIRLGLIGGGTEPVRANQLCKMYVDDQPISSADGDMTPSSPLAVAQIIFYAAMCGMDGSMDDKSDDEGGEGAEKKQMTD